MEIFGDAVFPALLNLFSLQHFSFLMLGIAMGFILGILPGLGSIAGLSLLIPFTFGMEPSVALAMMIGLIAPQHTSDTLPAILMGIPGSSAAQATVLDGFALAKRGEAARALSAAFLSSMIGGLIGALVLSFSVFLAKPVVLAMGFPELMMLVIWSLSMVGMLTGRSALKGLAACGVGILIGTVGGAPATGEIRFTMGSLYLMDGLSLVTTALAVFAIPEIIDLLRKNSTIAENRSLGTGWSTGIRDAIRHRWIIVRCSMLGCVIGALPGVGSSVVDWLAYGHVIQSSKDKENFGKGDIRGVIAPESANNATAGGSLVPTLLFGVPGSGSMAVLLGGFIVIGITPGPEMLSKNLDLTFTIIWSLALANLIGAGACFLLANPFSRLTTIRYALIAPVMLVLIFFGAYQATMHWNDIFAVVLLGVFAVYLRRFGWPRPALIIGFVLSTQLENSVYRAVHIYGFDFFDRPIVLFLIALTAVTLFFAVRTKTPDPDSVAMADESARHFSTRLPQIVFTCLLIGFCAYVVASATQVSYQAALFPLSVGCVTLVLLGTVAALQFLPRKSSVVLADSELITDTTQGNFHYILWIVGFVALIGLLGFVLASAVFVIIFTTVKAGAPILRNVAIAMGVVATLTALSFWLHVRYPEGLLHQLADMPWWLG